VPKTVLAPFEAGGATAVDDDDTSSDAGTDGEPGSGNAGVSSTVLTLGIIVGGVGLLGAAFCCWVAFCLRRRATDGLQLYVPASDDPRIQPAVHTLHVKPQPHSAAVTTVGNLTITSTEMVTRYAVKG